MESNRSSLEIEEEKEPSENLECILKEDEEQPDEFINEHELMNGTSHHSPSSSSPQSTPSSPPLELDIPSQISHLQIDTDSETDDTDLQGNSFTYDSQRFPHRTESSASFNSTIIKVEKDDHVLSFHVLENVTNYISRQEKYGIPSVLIVVNFSFFS